MNTQEARQEIARLEGLKAEQEAKLAALDEDLKRLELERGEAALAAVDGAGTSALEAAITEVGTVRAQRATCTAVIAAVELRLKEARNAQRQAICDELTRRADELDAEVAKREKRLSELVKALQDFEESLYAVTLHPTQRKTVLLKQRAETLRNAPTFVARGLPCPVDVSTGCKFDADLW